MLIRIKKRKQGNHPIPENRVKCGLPSQSNTMHILKIILIHIYRQKFYDKTFKKNSIKLELKSIINK